MSVPEGCFLLDRAVAFGSSKTWGTRVSLCRNCYQQWSNISFTVISNSEHRCFEIKMHWSFIDIYNISLHKTVWSKPGFLPKIECWK